MGEARPKRAREYDSLYDIRRYALVTLAPIPRWRSHLLR